jgi:hypothetical protein
VASDSVVDPQAWSVEQPTEVPEIAVSSGFGNRREPRFWK